MPEPIQITDAHGEVTVADVAHLLPDGVVVITHGLSGTVAQRFYDDHEFHTTTGKVLPIGNLLEQPNVYILYTPED